MKYQHLQPLQTPPDPPRDPPGTAQGSPRDPQGPPRDPQGPPRTPRDFPGTPGEPPGSPWGPPRDTQETPQGPPQGPQAPPRGSLEPLGIPRDTPGTLQDISSTPIVQTECGWTIGKSGTARHLQPPQLSRQSVAGQLENRGPPDVTWSRSGGRDVFRVRVGGIGRRPFNIRR